MSGIRDREGRTRRKLREMLEALGFTGVHARVDFYLHSAVAGRMVRT